MRLAEARARRGEALHSARHQRPPKVVRRFSPRTNTEMEAKGLLAVDKDAPVVQALCPAPAAPGQEMCGKWKSRRHSANKSKIMAVPEELERIIKALTALERRMCALQCGCLCFGLQRAARIGKEER